MIQLARFSALSAAVLAVLCDKGFCCSIPGTMLKINKPKQRHRRPAAAKVNRGSPQISHSSTTSQIIGAAIKIHRRLGPGLLESAYEACLAYELENAGLRVQRQKPVPLIYKAVKLECGFRADMVVNDEVVVEIKGKEAIHPADQAQLLSHSGS